MLVLSCVNLDKFQNKIKCVCTEFVIFNVIDDIECDWGSHVVIQCPNCEELFSTDGDCPAFSNISKLFQNNPYLYSTDEKLTYYSNSHT